MRDSDVKRYKLMVRILTIVVVIFALVMAYFFLVRPLTNKFIVEKQTEAQIATYNFIVNDMVAQLQQNGYYQLPIGNETLILVPWQEPQEQVQQ